jgi:hypothetical protein
MIDLTKLSDKELAELRKQISLESANRGCKIKGNALVVSKLIDLGIEEKLTSQGITDDFDKRQITRYLEKAIYKITDVTIGNYVIKERTGGNRTYKSIICNGADLKDEMYDDFCNMTSDIIDVIAKYFKKED